MKHDCRRWPVTSMICIVLILYLALLSFCAWWERFTKMCTYFDSWFQIKQESCPLYVRITHYNNLRYVLWTHQLLLFILISYTDITQQLSDYRSSENTFTLRWKFTHVSIWIFFPQSIKLFYESEPISFRREQKISSGGFSPLATMTQRYWSSRLKVPMRFTVAKNKGITISFSLIPSTWLAPCCRCKMCRGWLCRSIVKTLSPVQEGRDRAATGSMKNDDAALVKEMKSGLVAREKAEGWKTIDGDKRVYCLRTRSRTKKRGLIRCGSEITVEGFEKWFLPSTLESIFPILPFGDRITLMAFIFMLLQVFW